MESANTQRANQQTDADRLQQEHAVRMRELRKQQTAEIKSIQEKHERDMKQAEAAYRVELSAKKSEFEQRLQELEQNQSQRLDKASKLSDVNLKQAQETYRMQAEEIRNQGEKRLQSIRQQQAEAQQNIEQKGNA